MHNVMYFKYVSKNQESTPLLNKLSSTHFLHFFDRYSKMSIFHFTAMFLLE